MSEPQSQPGWYYAQGDPAGTQRYWDGTQWVGSPVQQPGLGGAGGAQDHRTYGGAGQRLVARIVDGLIVAIPILILFFATVDFDDFDQGSFFVSSLVGLVIGAAYEIGFIGLRGATPGKSLFGLKVINGETGETPPGLATAAIRWVLALAGLIPGIGSLLSLGIAIACGVMISSDDENRSLYDRIAKTLVVKT